MKIAQLVNVNANTGRQQPAGEIVLVCNGKEARIIFTALDELCARNPDKKEIRELYHTLGWNPGMLDA